VRSARPVLFLCALIAGAATRLGSPLVDVLLLPFLAALLAAQLDRESGQLAELVVRGAAKTLPSRDRADIHDEWLDHVRSAGEHGVLPLTRALSIALIAAPSLAVGLRVGRRRRVSG
jgi:hypothetical protein